MDTDLMTLKDLAEYLKMSDRTLYGYAQKGLLPGPKIGSAWRFRKADIDAGIEEQRQLTEQSTSARRKER
jgi:excisionase family DNA binding protein